MKSSYDANLRATVLVDDDGRLRAITHLEYHEVENLKGREASAAYLRDIADHLDIALGNLGTLEQPVTYFEPREQGIEYRFSEEKPSFDTTTYGYYQTYLNTPVWGAGLTATVKMAPSRIVSAANNSLDKIDAKLPSPAAIERFRRLFSTGEKPPPYDTKRAETTTAAKSAGSHLLDEILGQSRKRTAGRAAEKGTAALIRGRFYIYRYEAAKRTQDEPFPADQPLCGTPPTLPLPPLPRTIKDGRSYLVAELVFRLPVAGRPMNWRMLVDVETNAVLYLRALSSGITGLVFESDPITTSGVATNTADKNNATLNPHRSSQTLANLNPPGANQALQGTWASLTDIETPVLAAPTRSAGNNFDIWNARTDEFSAVNAYYHTDRFFRMVQDLGFTLSGALGYFGGTSFPVEVDHRGLGNAINAHCVGDGDGIDHCCFALADATDLANPIGIASDWRVVLHELGGHGILYDHVNSPNFGFSHSAGDSFAMIMNDYASQWHSGAAIDRFVLAPFVTFFERRSDRLPTDFGVINCLLNSGGSGYSSDPTVTISGGGGTGARAVAFRSGSSVVFVSVTYHGTGFTSAPTVTISGGGGSGATATAVIGNWAWGGTADLGGYLSEQILSSTLFRAYRSIGGDSIYPSRRQFAARCMSYLILRAVGTLTPGTNPSNPAQFLTALLTADAGNWTSEGIFGGAYGKVLSWAFEKQNLNGGVPPAVDVYIDDGRAGEYPYQAVHWQNMSMWNRNGSDGLPGHQNAIESLPNYMYGMVKNRGTSAATSVTVRAYHSLPGAGLTWPSDFVEMSPIGGLAIANVPANNASAITVGPFEWQPNINAYGHDCVLMIASVAGDPSNVDNFTGAETVQEWRLVPNDNNVGQRNVSVVPGFGGSGGLLSSLRGAFFMAGNNLNQRATMELRVEMPPVLEQKGWRLELSGVPATKFPLKAGEKRRVGLQLKPGAEFTREEIAQASNRMINISLLANGMLLGGMSYYIDPDLKQPSGGKQQPETNCDAAAEKLLDCLHVSGGRKVKKVCVKRVSVDIELDNDCCD